MSRIFKYKDHRIDLDTVQSVHRTEYVQLGATCLFSDDNAETMNALRAAFDAYHAHAAIDEMTAESQKMGGYDTPDPLADLDAWCKEHEVTICFDDEGCRLYNRVGSYLSPAGWGDFCEWPSLPALWQWLRANPPTKEPPHASRS